MVLPIDVGSLLLLHSFKFERPEDDCRLQVKRTEILNRIDQEYGCDFILCPHGDGMWTPTEYCGLPEHDPFTNRCYHHGVSGHLPGGSI